MTTVTFNGTPLDDPSPLKITETDHSFEAEFECHCTSASFANYNALRALAGVETTATVLLAGTVSVQSLGGTSGSLVIGTTTYTNCWIAARPKLNEVAGTGGMQWTYTLKFVRDTTI